MSIFQLGGLEEVAEILSHLELWTQFRMRIKTSSMGHKSKESD
jgi:hypothetical protein